MSATAVATSTDKCGSFAPSDAPIRSTEANAQVAVDSSDGREQVTDARDRDELGPPGVGRVARSAERVGRAEQAREVLDRTARRSVQ